MSNFHPVKRLKAPDGSRAGIDAMLAPLIAALWARGYETVGCCQDLGESLRDRPRGAAYWKGYALLEMPEPDALRLVDAVKLAPAFEERMHWAADGAWEMSAPLLPFGPFSDEQEATVMPWIRIYFPNDQVDDLVRLLAAA